MLYNNAVKVNKIAATIVSIFTSKNVQSNLYTRYKPYTTHRIKNITYNNLNFFMTA